MPPGWSLSWAGTTAIPSVATFTDAGCALRADGSIVSSVGYLYSERVVNCVPWLAFTVPRSLFSGGVIPSFVIESAGLVMESTMERDSPSTWQFGCVCELTVSTPGGADVAAGVQVCSVDWLMYDRLGCPTITALFDTPLYFPSFGVVESVTIHMRLFGAGVLGAFGDLPGFGYPLSAHVALRVVTGGAGANHVIVDSMPHVVVDGMPAVAISAIPRVVVSNAVNYKVG